MRFNAKDIARNVGGLLSCDAVRDLEDNQVTIKAFEPEHECGPQKDLKPVLFFKEIRQGLVINKARAQQLGDLFGDDDLAGKRVALTVDRLGNSDQVIIGGI